jgi:hypothetical protein
MAQRPRSWHAIAKRQAVVGAIPGASRRNGSWAHQTGSLIAALQPARLNQGVRAVVPLPHDHRVSVGVHRRLGSVGVMTGRR